jgi:hypothetical protein
VSAAADVGGLFTVALGRRVKAYYFWLTRNFAYKCIRESFFVLLSDAALLLAVQVQQVAQIFSEVVDCVDGQLYPEMRGVWVGDRDLHGRFLCSDRVRATVLRYRTAMDREVLRLEEFSWADWFLPVLATGLPAIPRPLRRTRSYPGRGLPERV